MENKGWKEAPYRQLIRQLWIRTLFMFILAFLVVMLFRSLGRGKVGNLIVQFYCTWFGVDWYTALEVYQSYRKYLDYFFLGAVMLLFLLFFRFLLTWFTKYLDEMVVGVNELVGNKKERIGMSPELAFMSDKLNQVKEQLERSAEMERAEEKRKNDLLVYLAHDIKTPLTSVIGYLSLLDEMPNMPMEQRAKYVHITLEKAYRLEKLIYEFFEITRYCLHTVPLQKEKIDLYHMMVQIVDEAYPQFVANHKAVDLHISDDLTLYADPEKMARVFNNILKNAITYGESGCTIEIWGEQKEGKVQIRFINDGVIPENELHLIFDKFYRVDKARQTVTGGSGLGLAIAKDIVTLHEGTITVTCTEGQTIFTILFLDNCFS